MITQGDWHIDINDKSDEFDAYHLAVVGNMLVVAICDRHGWDRHTERMANARLIKEAPNLYRICNKVIAGFAGWEGTIKPKWLLELIDLAYKTKAQVEGVEAHNGR